MEHIHHQHSDEHRNGTLYINTGNPISGAHKKQERQRALRYRITFGKLGEQQRQEEFNCLPSPRRDAKCSLQVSQNSSCYKLVIGIKWDIACTGIGHTLPNALDINRPKYKMAERSASSYEWRYVRETKGEHGGIMSLPSWCTISTADTSIQDKMPPTMIY